MLARLKAEALKTNMERLVDISDHLEKGNIDSSGK
jgi:hypothetical protein